MFSGKCGFRGLCFKLPTAVSNQVKCPAGSMPAGILKTRFRWSFSGTILRTDGAILMAGVFDHQRLFLAADEVSEKFLGQIFLAETKYFLVLAKHK